MERKRKKKLAGLVYVSPRKGRGEIATKNTFQSTNVKRKNEHEWIWWCEEFNHLIIACVSYEKFLFHYLFQTELHPLRYTGLFFNVKKKNLFLLILIVKEANQVNSTKLTADWGSSLSINELHRHLVVWLGWNMCKLIRFKCTGSVISKIIYIKGKSVSK